MCFHELFSLSFSTQIMKCKGKVYLLIYNNVNQRIVIAFNTVFMSM